MSITKSLAVLVLFTLVSVSSMFGSSPVNSLNIGLGYIGQSIALTNEATSPVFDVIVGTGQRFDLARLILYINENFNYIIMGNAGLGISGNFLAGWRVVGSDKPAAEFTVVPYVGAFLEFDIALNPFALVMAYGPSVGVNLEEWLFEGFGVNFNANLNINVGTQLPGQSPNYFLPSVSVGLILR